MKIYSQNVWDTNPSDYRNKLIMEIIEEENADICLFQECSPTSIRSGKAPLPDLISSDYAEVLPEKANVNYTPIFYKKQKYTLIEGGYFLYDGLNNLNSKSATCAVVEDKATLKRFIVVSTHFWWKYDSEKDNQQRLKNVDQLKENCDKIISKYGVEAIIGGDFNNGENAKQGNEPYKKMLLEGFRDLRLIAKESTNTLTRHDNPVLIDGNIFRTDTYPNMTIDYIFTYGPRLINPLKFDVLTSQKALDSSDHCPLLGEFDI